MAPARKRPSALGVLEWLAVLALGALLGSALAGLARGVLGDGPLVAALARTWRIGLQPPATLDLKVLSFTLGATLDVGLLTLVGAGLALWLYLRLR